MSIEPPNKSLYKELIDRYALLDALTAHAMTKDRPFVDNEFLSGAA